MEDSFFNIPLRGPAGEIAKINIIQITKHPMGERPYYIWKVYFTGAVIEVGQELHIEAGQPLPEWHRSIINKIKELTVDK